MKTWTITAALLLAATAGFGFAQGRSASTGAPASRQADEAAIRQRAQALARAFERGDARAVADFWTEEGEYMDEGNDPIHGRAALEKAYASLFSTRPELKAEAKTDKIRFLGKDTAVEEGTFTVHARGVPDDSSRYSTLYVRQDGRWMIALLKEWGDETTGTPSLQSLAWLIGSWESDGGDAQARTTYEWAENKKFIRARYSIRPRKQGEKPSSGTQVIGVDPVEGVIRAWTFDSEGGIGDAYWTWDGSRWVIDSTGALPDGSQTTAVNYLIRSGNDAFTWRSVNRTVDDESMPDLGTVRVKRVRAGR